MLHSHIIKKREAIVKEVMQYLEEFGIKLRLNKKIFLAGGAVFGWEMGVKVNDFDFYFYDEEYANLVAEKLFDINSEDIMITDSAITIKPLKVQLVLRFTGEPKDVIQRFDFAHTHCYATHGYVYISPDAYKSKALNKLHYTGSEYPLSALFRIKKFLQRGWGIDVSQFVKIAYDLQDYDLSDTNVLSDQLIGVDIVLFDKAIENLRNFGDILSKENIFQILDEVFE